MPLPSFYVSIAGRMWLTDSTRIQRPHVKDIHALHLAQNFQALETGGLLQIGRDGAGLAAGGHEVGFRIDLCGTQEHYQHVPLCRGCESELYAPSNFFMCLLGSPGFGSPWLLSTVHTPVSANILRSLHSAIAPSLAPSKPLYTPFTLLFHPNSSPNPG